LGGLPQSLFQAHGFKGPVYPQTPRLLGNLFYRIFLDGVDSQTGSEGQGSLQALFQKVNDKNRAASPGFYHLEQKEADSSSAKDRRTLPQV
jgi:hypothetical protein